MQYPQQPAPTGPPPKKSNTGKIIGFGCLGIIGLFFAAGIITTAVTASDDPGSSDKPAATDDKKDNSKEQPVEEQPEASQADQFKAFVEENGTTREQDAVNHVTKVQGADEQNDILDSVEIWTDYSGGIVGPHASDGKIIASAFADWKDSDNGLVTVYGQDGELLSNGNF